MIKKLVTIILLALTANHAFAQQDQIFFKEYGVKEGLPEELAFSFLEDKQGFIWIGTQNGLVKFDGYEMKSFGINQQQGKSNSLLQRNLYLGVMKSRDGRLWLGGADPMNSGLSIYNPEEQSFTNYLYHPDSTLLPFSSSLPILEDYNQNIWFFNFSLDQDTTVLGRFDQRTESISYYPERTGTERFNDLILTGYIAQSKVDSSLWILQDRPPYQIKKFNAKADSFQTIFKAGDQVLNTVLPDTLNYLIQSEKYFITGNNNRAFLIDPVQKKVISYYDFKLSQNKSVMAFIDKREYLWLGSGKNLSMVNLKDNTRKDYEFGASIPYPNPGEIDLLLQQYITDADIYFELYQSIKPSTYLRYHYETETFYVYDQRFNVEQNPVVNKAAGYTRFHKDFSDTRWIGTRPNIFKEDVKRIKSIRKFGETQVAIDSLINLFEDSRGRVWVSYYGGVMVRKKMDEPFQLFDADQGDFPFREAPIFLEDSKGQIWMKSSFLSKKGIARYDEKSGRFWHYLKGTQVLDLFFDRVRNQLWMTKSEGIFAVSLEGKVLYQLAPAKTKGFSAINNFQDSKGAIWFNDYGDNEHGLIRLEVNDSLSVLNRIPGDENSLSSNEVIFVIEDNFHNIWIGTDGGLNKFSNGKFERINLNSIQSYSIGKNNELWFTTYSGEGLLQVDPESRRVTAFGMQKGLLHNDNQIANRSQNKVISTDSEGRIYIPTVRGLSVFDPRDKTFSNFTGEQGLTYTELAYQTLTLSNGEVWFLSPDAIDIIDPNVLFGEKNTIPPKVWITSMTIMDSVYAAPDGEIFTKAVDFTDKIELSHWQKDLSFDFVALHYMRPEDNLYSWKLEGYDDEWSEPSRQRKAIYTNLSPGTYTFRVKGSNADGVWNEVGDFITITIKPPLWLTTGAFILYGLLFIAAVVAANRYQQNRTILKERERQKDEKLAQAKQVEEAYHQLKSTQAQLIQSEKMASLGELTAGIADEIQNPLNFVNNFSEVSGELIDEMNEEIEKGDFEEVKFIASDLKENLSKINHHGKRADAIVKGMLEHSRANKGEKAPTDLNTLADEFVRLSYHGLRAKDKSFNADFNLELDPNLPKVNVVSSDIGRVILNLVNNAFYAVNDKAKSTPQPSRNIGTGSEGGETYKPLVTIKTTVLKSPSGDLGVEISVQDNGSGIPEHIKEKIFQPFFTTKPTGSGTGLGLSLSYDIVKVHGGELRVDSKEGEGTEFMIYFPLKDL
ncbi:MAG: ATP-binding protein [Algoriphagus sp.]|uniref:ATP-binding protein n=1 Tax=Algoriphagus sp. TaxID=1872435 RepID=UPI00261BE849|nr:ATP-binding protein [Algoriphagus sp.]MDG1277816.1 ATP-binding protein [Algoriphagus sp.]